MVVVAVAAGDSSDDHGKFKYFNPSARTQGRGSSSSLKGVPDDTEWEIT